MIKIFGLNVNIQLHTLSQIHDLQGKQGNFIVCIFTRSRYADSQKCIHSLFTHSPSIRLDSCYCWISCTDFSARCVAPWYVNRTPGGVRGGGCEVSPYSIMPNLRCVEIIADQSDPESLPWPRRERNHVLTFHFHPSLQKLLLLRGICSSRRKGTSTPKRLDSGLC